MDIQTHLRKANQYQKRVAQIIIMVICVEWYGRRDADRDAAMTTTSPITMSPFALDLDIP